MSREPHLIAAPSDRFPSRRAFLRRSGNGFGLLALAGLLDSQGMLASAADVARPASPALNPLAPKAPHFPAQARSVIWLFMNGGQSQVDTWDYKPELEKYDGKELEGFDAETA